MNHSQRDDESNNPSPYKNFAGYQDNYNNYDNDSSSQQASSSDSFTDESSDYSNNSDDGDFVNSTARKPTRKQKQTTAPRQPAQRSGTRRNFDKQYSLGDTIDSPRKSKKVYDSSDSSSESTSDHYSNSEHEDTTGIALRDRSRRNTTNMNYAEDDDDESSHEEEDLSEVGEPKEEYVGPQIERVIGTEIQKKGEKRRYFVKYKNEAYVHCRWLTHAEILDVHNGVNAIKKWKREKKKNNGNMEVAEESVNNLQILSYQRDIISPDYFEVFRVIAYDPETEKYLVLWSSANQIDDEYTWEFETDIDNEAALNAFHQREQHYSDVVHMERTRLGGGKQRPDMYYEYSGENVPKFKDGLELRDYQLIGLNWLRKCWYEHKSSILADEMGLGKTVQGVCIVNEIYKLGYRGPFLAIAPKSTLMQWEREFHSWTDLNVVRYSDGKKAREIIRKYELYWQYNGVNDERYEKFEVMLMNYEKLLQPDVQEIVNKFTWEYVLVDEAHRLKNSANKTYQIFENLLNEKKIKHLLLMTGTPMQNQSSDVWGLLHLIDPDKFNDLKSFQDKFDTGLEHEELQRIIQPYMLRRVKNEVEKTIGTKEENIVEIELSKTQRSLYSQIPKKNATQSTESNFSTNNVKMQLRKVCNHPYLLDEPKKPIENSIDDSERSDNRLSQLINCCGKMMFVDKLLGYLREERSKVLIFSQMTQILDLFEEYCHDRSYKFERIDGQVKGSRRQQAMDRFNDPKTDTFIFLLCTKAGGQGLNLTAANYVIIYDSDWNPQNDIQAQARCHRIGQKNKVEVFRLVSRGTYETKMLKESLNKMKLDQAIQNDDKKGRNEERQEDIRYIIRVSMEAIKKSIPELLDSKVTVKSNEDMEEVLESENKEGDIDSKEFWLDIQRENEITEERYTRYRRRVRYSSSDDMGDAEDDDFPTDFKLNRFKSAFLKFGWGKWGQIRRETKLEVPDGEIQELCSVILWAILNPTKNIAEITPGEYTLYSNITGYEGLSISQQKKLKKLFRDHKIHQEFLSKKDRDRRRVFELKLFNDFFDTESSRMPVVDVPSDAGIPWSPTDDWSIVKGIQEYGWDNWRPICDNIPHEGTPLDDMKKFIKKRFRMIFMQLDGFTDFAKQFNIHLKQHKHHTERHAREQRRKERKERKEQQKIKEMQDPRIQRLKLLSHALCLFGEPITEANWNEFEQYCNCTDNSDHNEIPRLINASHRLLASKTRDPESVFEEERELRFMTEKDADEIATSCSWFKRFRAFYPEEFDSSKLSSLDSTPDWWNHNMYDPVLFKHIDLYGFSRPYSLLSQPPFVDMISASSVKKVTDLAHQEEQSHTEVIDHREPPDVSPLELLVQRTKLMNHIDLIINDIQTDKLPQIVITVDPKELQRFELPKILGNSYLESLGEGEFKAIDGYLFRPGFAIKVKYNNQTYQCKINTSGYTPFQVTPSNGRECIGKTPLEAWVNALDGNSPNGNPFELFGIGHPVIRYWMQKELGDTRVSDYRTIKFEMLSVEKQKKPKEEKPNKKPIMMPAFGKARRKGFFPPPPPH